MVTDARYGQAHGEETEVTEGYVVDLACIRKFPRAEMAERGRVHTRDCALMPHCMESGYGLISESGTITPLDPAATPRVVEALRGSARDAGIRVRAIRELRDGDMETVAVEEI